MSVPRTELGAHLAALRDMATDAAAFAVAADLCEFFACWSVDELDVLGWVAERLNLGRKRYGVLDLETDVREWVREAHEEAIDLAVYRAIAAMGAALAPEVPRAPCPVPDGEEEGEMAEHSCASEVGRDKWARDGRREPGDEWVCSCGSVLVRDTSGGWAKRVPVEEMDARLRVRRPEPWEVPPPSSKPGKGSRWL